jgi:hypothetical protein
MHLLLCSRALGLSDGLSASNNVQLYSCSPLPLLSFTLTSLKPLPSLLYLLPATEHLPDTAALSHEHVCGGAHVGTHRGCRRAPE